MKKYKLSLDESTPNSMQVKSLISVEADTLVGLLSKFLLSITAMEEDKIEVIKAEILYSERQIKDDDIPF